MVSKDLLTSSEGVSFVIKENKHSQWSDIIMTTEFVQRVEDHLIGDLRISTRAIAKHLQKTESAIRGVVHENLRHETHMIRRYILSQDRVART